ncbi:MAG: hypothetical protein EZS28_048251 [Streblomastix strix]|uniref:Uncharacterized protein n=1 Tax=Streblomastix strix TaxID=222440 RepID=A0A5J4TEL4_9EUKA|nr:MAG: hypothetical protein EZS28_048251 [Streblomastix strix]
MSSSHQDWFICCATSLPYTSSSLYPMNDSSTVNAHLQDFSELSDAPFSIQSDKKFAMKALDCSNALSSFHYQLFYSKYFANIVKTEICLLDCTRHASTTFQVTACFRPQSSNQKLNNLSPCQIKPQTGISTYSLQPSLIINIAISRSSICQYWPGHFGAIIAAVLTLSSLNFFIVRKSRGISG